jgi:hypothetical protein
MLKLSTGMMEKQASSGMLTDSDSVRPIIDAFHLQNANGGVSYAAIVELESGCKLVQGTDLDDVKEVIDTLPHGRYWIFSVVSAQ